ncbi:MAG TPA: glycosyltransferase [Bacteroidota bacterium]|nr:glycosyltransferase [Bacteroidota bacterium]
MMKICYLSTFYPYRGGIAQFNASLYRALGERHEVTAFNFTRQYPDMLFPGKSQYVQPGDIADPVETRRTLDSINPLSFFKTAAAINRLSPDLLVMKYWMSFFGPSLGAVAGRMKPPTKVVTVLDNVIAHEKRFFDVPFTKYFLRRNHGFVAMSSGVEDDLVSLAGPEVRRMRIPHPLYDHFGTKTDAAAARARLGIPPGSRVVLFFGFIRDYKGLDLLIEAIGALDERYALVIAGETYGSFEKYDAIIRQSPMKKSIFVFNDYIPDSRVPDFFSAADVCVLPYRSATQSGITSIAYHFDLPVIATDVGGLAEDVSGRGTGLVVHRPAAQDLADGIRKYFDSGMISVCVEQITRVKREESWSNFAEKLTAFAGSL